MTAAKDFLRASIVIQNGRVEKCAYYWPKLGQRVNSEVAATLKYLNPDRVLVIENRS